MVCVKIVLTLIYNLSTYNLPTQILFNDKLVTKLAKHSPTDKYITYHKLNTKKG